MSKIKSITSLFLMSTLFIPTFDVQADSPLPLYIETGEYVFDVVLSGEVPVDEFQILQFVQNVYVAHNTLAGKYFSNTAKIRYSDGTILEYEATETIILQAINPYDPATKYTDGTYIYTSDDIHHRIFPRGEIIFATCYDKNGQVGWGRKFIIMNRKG